MDKGTTKLSVLIGQYATDCRLQGKPETTCEWYRAVLERFHAWAGDLTLDDLTLEKAREYLAYLKDRPRYAGHPTTPTDGRKVSANTFRHHAVVLRVFARWLFEEGYTKEHRLERIPTPKVPEVIVEVLEADEVKRILAVETPNTPMGARNHAMLVLALDTGLRSTELATLEYRHLDLERGVLRAFGKGQKERMVPFGLMSTKALQRYLLHFRPAAALAQGDYVFLQESGWPIKKSTMQMVARRIADKSRIARFHWHLLRHTFAVNYLVNGGDAFSLQRMLGHTTLEMVRRYMHLADVHVQLQHKRYSPMDILQSQLGSSRVAYAEPKKPRRGRPPRQGPPAAVTTTPSRPAAVPKPAAPALEPQRIAARPASRKWGWLDELR